MSERKDIYFASRLLLQASKLLYPYTNEVANSLLEVSKTLMNRLQAKEDPEVEKYLNVLEEKDPEQARYEEILGSDKSVDSVYGNMVEKMEKDADAFDRSDPSFMRNMCIGNCNECEPSEDIMKCLRNIKNEVLDKLEKEGK